MSTLRYRKIAITITVGVDYITEVSKSVKLMQEFAIDIPSEIPLLGCIYIECPVPMAVTRCPGLSIERSLVLGSKWWDHAIWMLVRVWVWVNRAVWIGISGAAAAAAAGKTGTVYLLVGTDTPIVHVGDGSTAQIGLSVIAIRVAHSHDGGKIVSRHLGL